ncbi:hypothetical protein HAX54_037442 [Datura stramonium]|uniref:Uncharacterized protein n=1 Tax=Datura stramonium TaxID=4076 RepID=A0ABS8VI94_DATST|nr:hypothetical protein [Datura stramonium]
MANARRGEDDNACRKFLITYNGMILKRIRTARRGSLMYGVYGMTYRDYGKDEGEIAHEPTKSHIITATTMDGTGDIILLSADTRAHCELAFSAILEKDRRREKRKKRK